MFCQANHASRSFRPRAKLAMKGVRRSVLSAVAPAVDALGELDGEALARDRPLLTALKNDPRRKALRRRRLPNKEALRRLMEEK